MPKFTNQIRTCTPTTLEYSFSCALEKLEHKYRVEGGRKSWNRCNKRRRDKWKEREKKRKRIHGWMRLRPLILFVWNRCANERKGRKEERKKRRKNIGM